MLVTYQLNLSNIVSISDQSQLLCCSRRAGEPQRTLHHSLFNLDPSIMRLTLISSIRLDQHVPKQNRLLQDSRLNYIQQHAERIGLDAGRLDSVRVSAARTSPMGDTLDLCARYADASSVEALVPRLVPLVRALQYRASAAKALPSARSGWT